MSIITLEADIRQHTTYARSHTDSEDVPVSRLGCILGLFGLLIVAIAVATNSVTLGMLALIPTTGAIIFCCVGLVRMISGRESMRALYRALVGLASAGLSTFYVVTTMIIAS